MKGSVFCVNPCLCRKQNFFLCIESVNEGRKYSRTEFGFIMNEGTNGKSVNEGKNGKR